MREKMLQKYVAISSKYIRTFSFSLVRLASRGNGGAVDMVGSTLTETTAGERPPEGAPVSTTVPVGISLDPGITSSGEGWVARLKGQGIEEEVKEDGVTSSAPKSPENMIISTESKAGSNTRKLTMG